MDLNNNIWDQEHYQDRIDRHDYFACACCECRFEREIWQLFYVLADLPYWFICITMQTNVKASGNFCTFQSAKHPVWLSHCFRLPCLFNVRFYSTKSGWKELYLLVQRDQDHYQNRIDRHDYFAWRLLRVPIRARNLTAILHTSRFTILIYLYHDANKCQSEQG